MRSQLESAFHLAKTLPAEKLPRLLGDLEEIRAVALARLSSVQVELRPDELLDIKGAALRLHVSEDYLYHHHKRLPFTRREGRALRFSSNGIDSYIKKAR